MNNAGRKPITVVELVQPRCTNRYGIAPCTASGPSPCYNCPGTCDDIDNLNTDGSITWRFTSGRPDILWDEADFSDPDNIVLNPIPCGVTVSTSESEINAGGNIEGKSNLGVTGTVDIGMKDFQTRDLHGDFYKSQRAGVVAGRPPPIVANHWALWTARNELFNEMFLGVYDGFEGEVLSNMRKRVYALDTVNGPNGTGGVSLKGIDPLRLAGDNRAQFPKTSDLDLFGALQVDTATVSLFGAEADLTSTFGNTVERYIAINSEIISYTGYTDEGDGVRALTGVLRAQLGTAAAEHSDNDPVQRVGRYENELAWRVFYDLYVNHTDMPATFLPLTDWDLEGNTYLPTSRITRTVVAPKSVATLAGQVAQQYMFYVWWQPYAQQVKMLAVRPPDTAPTVLTDEKNLLRGSVLTRDPKARLSQITVYYGPKDPFGSETDDDNFSGKYTLSNGDNLGETRVKVIYAPWVERRSQAIQLAARLLLRYKLTPKFLKVTIDAKDRDIVTGDVTDIETAAIVDRDGPVTGSRWQVVGSKEVIAGQTYMLNLQTYEYVGRFAIMLADDAPDFVDATDEERENGFWFCDDDGKMPDGSEGYQFQ